MRTARSRSLLTKEDLQAHRRVGTMSNDASSNPRESAIQPHTKAELGIRGIQDSAEERGLGGSDSNPDTQIQGLSQGQAAQSFQELSAADSGELQQIP